MFQHGIIICTTTRVIVICQSGAGVVEMVSNYISVFFTLVGHTFSAQTPVSIELHSSTQPPASIIPLSITPVPSATFRDPSIWSELVRMYGVCVACLLPWRSSADHPSRLIRTLWQLLPESCASCTSERGLQPVFSGFLGLWRDVSRRIRFVFVGDR